MHHMPHACMHDAQPTIAKHKEMHPANTSSAQISSITCRPNNTAKNRGPSSCLLQLQQQGSLRKWARAPPLPIQPTCQPLSQGLQLTSPPSQSCLAPVRHPYPWGRVNGQLRVSSGASVYRNSVNAAGNAPQLRTWFRLRIPNQQCPLPCRNPYQTKATALKERPENARTVMQHCWFTNKSQRQTQAVHRHCSIANQSLPPCHSPLGCTCRYNSTRVHKRDSPAVNFDS